MKKFKESIHQQFERFMRDEMDDVEKDEYVKSERYKNLINIMIKNLKKRN